MEDKETVETTAIPTEKAEAIMRSFTGDLYQGAVTRTFVTADPGNPTRNVTSRKRFDLITNLQLTRVSGMGQFENTKEPFITLNGQYAPGKTARITASAQNVALVGAMLKGHVDKKNPEFPLTKDLVVEVVCTEWRGHGYMIQELYLIGDDSKSKTAIIGAPTGSTEPATAANDLF